MRPRIFSLMLTAFALVIVLGLVGMSAFFWLAVASVDRQRDTWVGVEESRARAEAARLADLYLRGDRWDAEAVQIRLNEIERNLGDRHWENLMLLDAQGRVVAATGRAGALDMPNLPLPGALPARPSMMMNDGAFQQVLPIEAGGAQVGVLVLTLDGQALMQAGRVDRDRIWRGFLSAVLALLAVLLGLAAFFSRRISTPLRQLTVASKALAAGDMSVRVRPSAVREVGELAGAFNSMADSLVLADQQRRQLTADVAHELRTPLSIIKGRLEGVQDGVYQPDEAQVAGLLSEVSLLERLIEDLRLLALADAGQLPFYPDTLDLGRLLQAAHDSFAPQAAQRGVELILRSDPQLPELQADPQRLAQVLGNLLSNALRHTAAGGAISLCARIDDACVRIEVADTGAGIAPEDLPYIFERFYRADKARTRSGGGAGLGLAIARRIVEAHGGRISAASTLGQGTTISLRLPVVAVQTD